MDTRISLRRLEVFCAVVDEGGVTRAAERLIVAQPAVSAQLRSLERSLGATLFHRSGNSFELTEAGERMYVWAKDVLAGSVQVQRDVAELASGAAGSVVIASSMAIGTYLLPPILTRIRAERPGAEITAHVSEPATALRSTVLGEVDFAVSTWLEESLPEALAARQLWEEPLVLCTGPTGPPHSDTIELHEIGSLPFVGPPPETAFHRMLVAQLRARGVTPWPAVIRLGHAEAIRQAVVANGWVTLAPAYAIAGDIEQGRLRAVRIRDARLVEGIGLYHRTRKYFSPLQQATVDAIEAVGAQRRPER